MISATPNKIAPANAVTIDINILAGDWEAPQIDLETLIHSSIIATIAAADLYEEIQNRALEVSVVLTDDKTIQTLNATYRNIDKPTNVLSFAALDSDDPLPPEGPVHLGDIILALETLQHESETMEKPLKNHLTHLVIHGMLHLLGYDHIEEEEANIMESLEISILSDFGIENPYPHTNFMK